MEGEERKPGNYLVFDGGLSGLPGLYTLEELLSRLQFDLNSDTELLPWHHFKVIIGSGPGGLIAIFVGRMKMTASEAIGAYLKLLPALLLSPTKDEEERRRNTEMFKSIFLDIIKEGGYDDKTPFLDENGPKTIVCTLNTTNPSVVQLIRSYRSRSAQTPACTILEAACACVASPDTFSPVTVGTAHKQVTLVDATTGFANPSQELLREAQRVFGADGEIATLVSIGAGKGDVWNLTEGGGEKQRLKALQRITMNCEPVHEDLWSRLRETGIYYRLNVDRGTGSKIQISSSHIAAYLQEGEISDKLDDAIRSIRQRAHGVKLKDINSVTTFEVRLKPRPSLVQNFVGRDDILQAMHQTHIHNHFPGLRAPAITVLSGLGGSGKTQIALRYPNTPVYFLNAESEETLKGDFETLVRSQGKEHRSKSCQDALVWLATELKNWLLILDNADNPSLRLFTYIPKCTFGNIIITTRNSNHATLAPNGSHQIEGLLEPDSVSLVLQSSGYENNETNRTLATEIVRELGNLPLALAQAAGYIFVNKCLSTYLSIYRNSRVNILASEPSQRPDDYPSSVGKTIEMSLGRLPQAAQDLMRLLAHLDSTSVPHAIIAKAAERQFKYVTWTKRSEFRPETLEHAEVLASVFCNGGEWSDFSFNELVTRCLQYSLLRITSHGDNRFYSMHVLVQSYLKASSALIQGHRPIELVVRLLGSSITYNTDYKYLSFNRTVLPHLRYIQVVDVVEAGDHFAFARVLHETCGRASALLHRERCVEMWRGSLGDEHENTHWAMTNLASDYGTVGRDQEALKMREQMVASRRKLSGPEHTDTLMAMHNLALSFKKVGQKEEAMRMEEQVLELGKKILGPEDPFRLATMYNLATSYSDLGRVQDGLKLREQVLEMRRRVLGPEHPDTMASIYSLAHSYDQCGKFKEALRLEEQVVELRMKVLGLEHPDTANAMWNMEVSLRRLEMKERLLELSQTAVPVYEKVWGTDHKDTIWAREKLTKLSQELEGRDLARQ